MRVPVLTLVAVLSIPCMYFLLSPSYGWLVKLVAGIVMALLFVAAYVLVTGRSASTAVRDAAKDFERATKQATALDIKANWRRKGTRLSPREGFRLGGEANI